MPLPFNYHALQAHPSLLFPLSLLPLTMMSSWQDKQSAAELLMQRSDVLQRHKQLQLQRSRDQLEGQRPTTSFGPLWISGPPKSRSFVRRGSQLVAPQLAIPHPASLSAAAQLLECPVKVLHGNVPSMFNNLDRNTVMCWYEPSATNTAEFIPDSFVPAAHQACNFRHFCLGPFINFLA